MVAMLVRPGAACLRIQHALDAELDGGGVERLAVVELDVATKLELPRRVVEEPPGLGQVALELERLEVAPEQGVEDLAVRLVGVLVAVHVPVERRRLAGLHDDDGPLLSRRFRTRQGEDGEEGEDPADCQGRGVPSSGLRSRHRKAPLYRRSMEVPGVAGLEVRIEGVSERVAEQVDPHDGHEQGRAGEEREPVARVHELPTFRQHAPPGGDREGHAEPEEGEPGLGQDGARHAERRHHDERGADVGQDVAPDDRRERDPEGARGVHERLLPGGQGLGAHDPGVGDPVAEADHQNDVADARPQDADDGDGQEDEREGELHVGQSHDDVIPETPAHPGQEAEAGAYGAGHQHRGEPDQDRRLGAVDDPAQDVTTQLVRAEDGQRAVGGPARRTREAREQLLLVRIGRRDPPGHDRARGDHEEDHRADPGARRFQQDAGPPPHAARRGQRGAGDPGREGVGVKPHGDGRGAPGGRAPCTRGR